MRQQDGQEAALGIATSACLRNGKALFFQTRSVHRAGLHLNRLLRSRARRGRFHCLKRSFQIAFRQTGDGAQAGHHQCLAQTRHGAESKFHKSRQHCFDPLLLRTQSVGAAEILTEAADEVPECIFAVGKCGIETLAPIGLTQQFVRVKFIGQRADAHIDWLGKEHFDGAVCGFLPSGIAIKEQHDAFGDALQATGVLAGECSTECCHGVGHTGCVAGDDVRVSLADECGAGINDGLLCQVNAVQAASLVEDAAFRRIQVFRLVFGVELPCPECNGSAHFIANRKDHPVAESVDWTLASIAHKAGCSEDIKVWNGIAAAGAIIGTSAALVMGAQAFEVANERIPSIGRRADIETFAHRFRNIACIEGGAGASANLRVRQRLAIEIGGDGVCAEQGASTAGGSIFAACLS